MMSISRLKLFKKTGARSFPLPLGKKMSTPSNKGISGSEADKASKNQNTSPRPTRWRFDDCSFRATYENPLRQDSPQSQMITAESCQAKRLPENAHFQRQLDTIWSSTRCCKTARRNCTDSRKKKAPKPLKTRLSRLFS